MNIIADLHTHTDVSRHAYSSLDELLRAASEKGLAALAVTNHGPDITDGAHLWHFSSLRRLPKTVRGVRLLGGAEVNLMDETGRVDLSRHDLAALDFVIASMHSAVYSPKDAAAHTETWLAAARNPHIDCLGHAGQSAFPFDIPRVVKACKETGTMFEFNAGSAVSRPDSAENCRKIALCCMEYGVPAVVSSDAHCLWEVGEFQGAEVILTGTGFPEELVINSSRERLEEYFWKRRGIQLFTTQ